MMNDTREVKEYPFAVVCIDDADKPWDFPEGEWLNKNEEYIVTGLFKDIISGDTSFKLLDHNPEPYKGYKANRFAIMHSYSVN